MAALLTAAPITAARGCCHRSPRPAAGPAPRLPAGRAGTRCQARLQRGALALVGQVRCGLAGAAAAAAVALSTLAPEAAVALGPTSIKLEDLTYVETECPRGLETMTQGFPACIVVSASATNGTKADVSNADVFGRILGYGGESALDREEASDAGRISNIDKIPMGTSTVEFPIVVGRWALMPGRELKFVNMKAVAYPGSAYGGLSPIISEDDLNYDCVYFGEGCSGDGPGKKYVSGQ
mmetsp:Transcript_61604/g.194947  ORF Transcript_61604/g.194947 Transcript_61604/m.194947 type:complete len:238 (+) Transcript_61604:51-764(+)